MKKYILLTSLLLLILAVGYAVRKVKQNQIVYTSGEPTLPITLSEIKKHGSKDDCWTAVDGSVYNMTLFVDVHPAGRAAILNVCGRDASNIFNSVPYHTTDIREQLKTFKIGVLINQ